VAGTISPAMLNNMLASNIDFSLALANVLSGSFVTFTACTPLAVSYAVTWHDAGWKSQYTHQRDNTGFS